MTKADFVKTINYDVNSSENIRLYHGTTHSGGVQIPSFGFSDEIYTVWNCSYDCKVYFYELERYAKVNGYEDESFKLKQSACIHSANEAGQIQEAFLSNPGKFTYVLEFILPPEIKEYMEEDDSCESMSNYGAVQVDIDILNELIKQDKCTINAYQFDFAPKCSLAYICGLLDNPYCSDAFDNFTQTEIDIMEALRKSNVLLEELFDISFEFDKYYGSQFDKNYYHN